MIYSCARCCSATNKHTPMSPLPVSTHPAHTHVSIADKHPPNTHPSLHCWSAPTQHTPMSQLLTSTHPAHPCLHCWSAPKKHTPMSPLLTNTQQAHTRVSIADEHPASTHPCLHIAPTALQSAPTQRTLHLHG